MYYLHIIAFSILFASTYLSVVLLLLHFTKKLKADEKVVRLVKVFNATFLLGSVLFTINYLFELTAGIQRGDEYSHYVLMNRTMVPYWLWYWWPIVNQALLPLLLIFKRLRASLIIVPIISLSSIVANYVRMNESPLLQTDGLAIMYYIIMLLHYAGAFAATYFLLWTLNQYRNGQ